MKQIAAIKEEYNAHRRNFPTGEDNPTPNNEIDSVPDSPVTIETISTNGKPNNEDSQPSSEDTADDVDDKNDDDLIVTPVSEIITLDERVKRIRKLQANVARAMIQIGFELIAAKEEIGHGGWADWLGKNFGWTQRTANNFMRMAERFGKMENVFQFQPSTLQAMLQLPAGDEQDFIEEQATAGKPIENQSAREVQKAVKQWNKAKEVGGGEYINVTGAEKNNQTVEEMNNAVTPTENNSKATDNPTDTVSDSDSNAEIVDDQDTITIEPNTVANARSILSEYELINPEQITAIRELINQTNDVQTINAIRNSLLELTREIGELVSLTEAKIEELSKRE